MKSLNNIRWISLQPLTGGMYLGFENVIGHPAECIISYKGLNDYKETKNSVDGRGKAGNEYNLTEYLRKKNRPVPRYEFSHSMFEMNSLPVINPDKYTTDLAPRLTDIDIVCAVPVCSGLSALTTTDKDQKEIKNCNMKFLAEYALKVIQPKIYVFENAPRFMSVKANGLREWFENLAWETHYKISYFSTDSRLHYNCQRRPRTFVIMMKDVGNTHSRMPDIGNIFENEPRTITDIFSAIPSDATYRHSLPAPLYENEVYINWAKDFYGDNWRTLFQKDIEARILKDGYINNLKDWCDSQVYATNPKVSKPFALRMIKHIEHIQQCVENGKGWWSAVPKYYPEIAPAVQSRTIYAMIHPTEDRLCSERELLTLMGMPYDFEMQGSFMSDGRTIGQNVPVRTAEWIARICMKYLKHEYDYCVMATDPHLSARYYDNIKQKIVF